MSAYFVFTKESIHNQAELDTYNALVAATFEGHPVKLLAAYGAQDVVEGEGPEGVVIAEFPTKEAAMAWYNSPEYVKVRAHRFAAGAYRATLVEGL